MSYNHDLNEGVADDFEFQLMGFTYKCRYPTTEEIKKSQADIEDTEKDSKLTSWLYSLISKVSTDAPDIEDALGKSNLKVLKNFNIMITSEFGTENKAE